MSRPPDAPTGTQVFADPVIVTKSLDLAPGRYVFCEGVTVAAGARLTGTEVFVQVVHGGVTLDHDSTLDLAAATLGDTENILLDVVAGDVVLPSGPGPDILRGLLHVPDSTVTIQTDSSVSIGAIVAGRFEVYGVGVARIGTPDPDADDVAAEPAGRPDRPRLPLDGVDRRRWRRADSWTAIGLPGGSR